MMKISMVHYNDASKPIASYLKTAISKSDQLSLDEKHPDIVISIGGDGTLLSAFQQYKDQLDQVEFIGIHTGHLGFYTDWMANEIDKLVHSLEHCDHKSVSYPLLSVTVTCNNGVKHHYLALNESLIKRLTSTLIANLWVDGQYMEKFRGDGLCVSTPTGSTAYNKSLGGAILCPELDTIQLVGMASISNRVFRTIGSPMIIPPTGTITIEPQDHRDNIITYDNQREHAKSIKRITYQVAKQRIYFAKYRHIHFWRRVSNAFVGEQQDPHQKNRK